MQDFDIKEGIDLIEEFNKEGHKDVHKGFIDMWHLLNQIKSKKHDIITVVVPPCKDIGNLMHALTQELQTYPYRSQEKDKQEAFNNLIEATKQVLSLKPKHKGLVGIFGCFEYKIYKVKCNQCCFRWFEPPFTVQGDKIVIKVDNKVDTELLKIPLMG
jgi:hypothetical protein